MSDTAFEVKGPFKVPTSKPASGGRRIDKEQATQFWKSIASKHPDIEGSRGCFIFCMQNSRGSKPGYVGKTIQKTFCYEAFSPAKLNIYNRVLGFYQKGTPVLFFVLTKNGRGVADHISHLETFLIQNAAVVNPFHLQNIQRSGLGWNIAGVLRGSGGQPTQSAKDLKKLLKIAHPPKPEHRETEDSLANKVVKTRVAKSGAKGKSVAARNVKLKAIVKSAPGRTK